MDSVAASTLSYLEDKAKEGLASLQKKESELSTATRHVIHDGQNQATAFRAQAEDTVRVARAKAADGKAQIEGLEKEAVEALQNSGEKIKEQVQQAKGEFKDARVKKVGEQEGFVVLEPLRAHGIEHEKLPVGFKKLI